jgi:GNAT superfamily N-acetyltransferase
MLRAGDDLAAFHNVAARVYASDPRYCAPSRDTVSKTLSRADAAGRQAVWVADSDGSPGGRVVAMLSPALSDEAGKPYGMLGYFECVDDAAVAACLFRAAADWLAARGARTVVGPMNGDSWHAYRLNTGPFDDPPFLMEPWNPSYYPRLWEANGFEALETYYSKAVDDIDAAVAGTDRYAKRAADRGYTLRRIDMARYDAELRLIYELTRRIFAGNFLYTDIPSNEFLALYAGSRRLLDPDLVWFADDPNGEPAGFAFAFPDRHRAVAAMRGSRAPLALLRFVLLRNRTDAVNLKTLGVTPEARRTGLAVALCNRVYRTARDKGYRRMNLCLIRDGNPSGKMDGGAGRVSRRYALYRTTVGAE